MSPQPRIPFHFHAEGHALSGEFRHPGRSLIEAQASASLPTIGGHARASVDHYFHSDFVSFRTAHTSVSGRRINDKTFKTHATTIIEDLNILDVVTADRIVSHLESTHDPSQPEGHIVAERSEFHNLRIAGFEVKVILRPGLLVQCPTFRDLYNHVEKGGEDGRRFAKNEKVIVCSLVDKIETKLPGVDPRKHVFEVPDFGKVSLAEVFAEYGTRTLTMLKLHLGSPHIADLTAAETRTNGQPPPPPLSGGG